jgi:hypothetical protein
MKRSTSICVVVLLVASSAITPAGAQSAVARAAGIAVPVASTSAAATFTGTFTLQRFVATPDGVAAVGLLTGVATPTGGVATSIVQTVTVPAQVQMLPEPAPAPAGDISIQQIGPDACGILFLDLGPLFLDLLGLQVDLSQVILQIAAQRGAGNLLGNLLCAVLGLLDGTGTGGTAALANVLNQILGILG